MSLSDAIRGILRGILQYALYLIPLVKPLQESKTPPPWWYKLWGYWDWTGNLDSDNRPNQAFIEKYLHSHFAYLISNGVDIANALAQVAVAGIRHWLGYLPTRYSSFAAWISNHDFKIGFTLPSWAVSVVAGLWQLWEWIPEPIRNNWQSWGQLLNSIADVAIAWAKSRYEQARRDIAQILGWWLSIGYQVGRWYQAASGFLDRFRQDPRGVVLGILGTAWHFLVSFRQNPVQWVVSWLGPNWQLLTSFASGPLRFYFDLWARRKEMIFDFLSDPFEFLWKHGEDFLIKKLE